MSRTVRRKSGPYPWYLLSEWKWLDGGDGWRYLCKVPLDPRSIGVRRKFCRYHSDAGFGTMQLMSAPHWYRRYLNKRCTRREQAAVQRWLAGYVEDVIFEPRVRDASYWW